MDPKRVRIIAVVVAVVVVLAGVGIFYYVSHRSSTSCALTSTNPLVFDQPETPDSLDPGVVFITPGWGIAQQTYQTLVMYNQSYYGPVNGSFAKTFDGELAKNWSTSADGLHWNFTLWPGEYFSNGDPINAYVIWWSLYRNLVIAQPIVFLLEENFYDPFVSYYSNLTAIQASNASLNSTLQLFNTYASVTSPPPSLMNAMTAQNQSFRIINSLTLQVNLGFGYLPAAPYTYLLDQLATPPFAAVDPLYILAPGHGGVAYGSPNSWMAGHMLGSGPFNLSTYDPSTGYTLVPNNNYWAKSIAAQEPWNNVLQPAKSSINIVFQGDQTLDVENLKSGAAAVASFAYIGPSTLSQLSGDSCINVQSLPDVYGALSASWWVYMDQNHAPFNNLSVRAAIIHAVNYSAVIQAAYGGHATEWLGPVPAGYPDYPSNVTPYQYNLPLAKQEIANSPCKSGCGPFNFEYVNVGQDPYTAALIVQSDLSQIGISLNLVGVTLPQLAAMQGVDPNTGACTSTESYAGGPFYIGENYYTGDYVSPDDAAQLQALSYGSYNLCMSEYANPTVDNLVYQALSTTNPTLAQLDYWQMTQIMYQNYSNVWLYIPTAFAVYSTHLQGWVPNPMGSGLPFTMVMNTEYAT